MNGIRAFAKGIAVLIGATVAAFTLGIAPAQADCFCYNEAGGRTCECW